MPQRKRRSPIPAFATAILILMTVTFALVQHQHRPQSPPISAWHAPTDFLLNTPGGELIHSVPDLKGTLR